VRVSEDSTNGGGDRGGVRWSSGRISGQDQSVDKPKNTSGAVSHHQVNVPGVAVNGDRMVHRRLRGQRRGRPVAMIHYGGVGEAGRARRGAQIREHRGRGAPVMAVDEGRIGEAVPAHRWGRSRRGGVWRRRG
jgi:hypothetical protein